MTTKTNQPQQKKDKDFGLPQVEFKPIAARGRQWFRITIVIVGLVLILGAGVVYWFFYYSPNADLFIRSTVPVPETHKTKVSDSNTDAIDDHTASKHQVTEQEVQTFKHAQDLKTLEGAEKQKKLSTPHTIHPSKGTITSINTTGGHYYIVLGSFFDEDLALDYAHRLAQKGVEVTLIAPPPKQYFFRVAIKQGDTFHNAHEKLEALKAVYGPDIWLMKY